MGRTPNERGFSLLEVLVAGALFVIGTTGVLSGWSSINGMIDTQRRSADAAVIADDILDDLRLQQRASADLTLTSHERFFDKERLRIAATDPHGFRAAWTVQAEDDFSFRRIDLVVSWVGVDSRPHQLAFLTFRPG